MLERKMSTTDDSYREYSLHSEKRFYRSVELVFRDKLTATDFEL